MAEVDSKEMNSGEEALLFSLAQMAKLRGDSLSVAVLADAHLERESEHYDNWNGGLYHINLRLQVDAQLYATLTPDDRERIRTFIRSEAEPILGLTDNEDLGAVTITPRPRSVPSGWRDQLKDKPDVRVVPPSEPPPVEPYVPNRLDVVAGHKLTILEMRLLERVLQMGNGYVLDFNNKTFAEFFAEHDVDVDHPKFNVGGTSKANRLRTYFKLTDPASAGKVLISLLERRLTLPLLPTEKDVDDYRNVARRFVAVPDVYDVTLSFAGEDRAHANAIATGCVGRGIRVFYDDYEKATLWGKDLYQHLSDVYANRAKFCVVFVSHHYAAKLWTNHELRAAQSRAFMEKREYILPVRLDDTQLPGLAGTTGYVEWAKHTPAEIVGMLSVKLGRT